MQNTQFYFMVDFDALFFYFNIHLLLLKFPLSIDTTVKKILRVMKSTYAFELIRLSEGEGEETCRY